MIKILKNTKGLDELSKNSGQICLDNYLVYVSLNTDWISKTFTYDQALDELDLFIDKKIKVKHKIDDDGFYCNCLSNDINMDDVTWMKRFTYKGSLIYSGQHQYSRELSRRSYNKNDFKL